MQLRQLRYFLKVVETGSITGAAKELRMTQPALSRQIRAFEDDCGWNLLDRGAKSIRLTKSGNIVAQQGKQMIQEVDARLEKIRQQVEGASIHIGYAPSLGGDLLKKAMASFIRKYPSARVTLSDSTSEEMRKRLLNGELDLILGAQQKDEEIEWNTLLEKQLRIAIPKSNPLAKKRKISTKHLDAQRILLLSRHEYPEYFKGVQHYFRSHGINAKVAGEFDGIESLRVALEAGIGIALVAEGATVGKDVKLLTIDPAPTSVKVAIGWRNDKSPDNTTAAFIEAIREAT